MGATSGLITTFDVTNYTGELFQLSPTDAPFLTMCGGLSGGKQTLDYEYEWETTDLRAPSANNSQLEGADAPTAEGRTRDHVTNICEIHMATVQVSFTKLAATQRKGGLNNDQTNPITDEVMFQLEAAIKSKTQDIELSFINGSYNKPSTNADKRKTRGIIPAITTNKLDIAADSDIPDWTSATDGTITSTAHGMSDGDQVVFKTLVTTPELSLDTPYFVVDSATNTFKVSETYGGDAITFAATGSGTGTQLQELTDTDVGQLLQDAFENGAANDTTYTLWVNAYNKRKLSRLFIKDSGYRQTDRNIGGVNCTVIETDFGTLNVALNRWIPKHKIVFTQMSEIAPVFLDVPGYGHFFVKPLPSAGAYEKSMLYGEIGLEYGAEKHHGLIVNTTIR